MLYRTLQNNRSCLRSINHLQSILHTFPKTSSSKLSTSRPFNVPELDPYVAKAEQDAPPQEKLKELREIFGAVKTAMLVTVDHNGNLHSRAMSPASTQGLVFSFIGNNVSGKFTELESNPKVNISYYDQDTTNWASIAGDAKIVNDKEKIKNVWNSAVKAWFGDLGDGKHTGNWDDPRVSLIEVSPVEIRYWVKTKSSIGQAIDVAKGAVTGKVAAPGNVRVIEGKDLELIEAMERK